MAEFQIEREVLEKVFGNTRDARKFQRMQQTVGDVTETQAALVADTSAFKDAVFVTLSSNAELDNERVLRVASPLHIDASTGTVTLSLTNDAPRSSGGYRVTFTSGGDVNVALPLTGILATRENNETFKNKTYDAPKFTGLGDYLDDVAAAAGGVLVGQVYHNAGALRIRLT